MQAFHRIRISQNKRNIKKKVTKPGTKTNSTNTKNQNQINILKKISIKIALKYEIINVIAEVN